MMDFKIISKEKKESFEYKLANALKISDEEEKIYEIDALLSNIYKNLDEVAIRCLTLKLVEDYNVGLLDDYFED